MNDMLRVKVPKEIELEDGEKITLQEHEIHELNIACMTFSQDKLIRELRRLNFKPIPAVPLGEIASLGKPLTEHLEIHVRVFKQGLVLSEIEISRIYIEHFIYNPVNGAYYLYELLRNNGFEDVHLIYRGRLVKKVLSFYDCEIVVLDNLHKVGELAYKIFTTLSSKIKENVVKSLNVLHRLFFPQQLQVQDMSLG